MFTSSSHRGGRAPTRPPCDPVFYFITHLCSYLIPLHPPAAPHAHPSLSQREAYCCDSAPTGWLVVTRWHWHTRAQRPVCTKCSCHLFAQICKRMDMQWTQRIRTARVNSNWCSTSRQALRFEVLRSPVVVSICPPPRLPGSVPEKERERQGKDKLVSTNVRFNKPRWRRGPVAWFWSVAAVTELHPRVCWSLHILQWGAYVVLLQTACLQHRRPRLRVDLSARGRRVCVLKKWGNLSKFCFYFWGIQGSERCVCCLGRVSVRLWVSVCQVQSSLQSWFMTRVIW